MNLNEQILFKEQGIYSQVVGKAGNTQYTLMCLSKGTNLDEHTSTKNGSILVLKGKGTFILEGKEIQLEEGVFFTMNANAKHSVKATENLAFLLGLSN